MVVPLHRAASFGYFNIVKILLEANADPNVVDDKGNTPLHNAIEVNHRSIVDILVEFGADVNQRNAYCETAASSLPVLTEEGKPTSASLCLAELSESHFAFKDVYIPPVPSEKKAKLKKERSFLSTETGQFRHVCWEKDCRGRTAGELAELLGYGDIVRLLSDENGMSKSDIFYCKDVHRLDSIRVLESTSYKDFAEELLNQSSGETSIDSVYTSIMRSPVLGSLEHQEECFKEEAKLVKDEVMRLMERFSEAYGRRYPSLAFDPKLRGSMSEGTKRGPPDEFDFLLIMNNLSEFLQLNSIDSCKAHTTFRNVIDIDALLKLPPNKMIDVLHIWLENTSSYWRDSGYRNPTNMKNLLEFSMKRIILSHSTWERSCLKFVSCDWTKVGLCMNLLFHGNVYKWLNISVDLVPCVSLKMPVPVNVSIDWPVPLNFSKCQLYGLFRDGCHGFDLSSTEYEEVLLKSLPSAAIDAYVLGKAFGSAQFKWNDNRLKKIFRKSYTMKKALLLSVQLHQNVQEVSRHEWLEGMISVALNMEKYVKKNRCSRCIFHAKDWALGQNDKIHLSFS
ncbi:hypothetical protein CAPTEDRAFT_208745 [Capitella teleta]|uniref:Uncharacterized protein n=1 Tax=Capitella teleta TaxID=283909 RepID=R7TD91_CAPTE|nr:hypothetical protein CAPTEDRAFT_208745 [Capitella teleta]|eukprot:ELT89036.1 hypothetical protein CAPTEDRAFT_208745 [Capitella teleta]